MYTYACTATGPGVEPPAGGVPFPVWLACPLTQHEMTVELHVRLSEGVGVIQLGTAELSDQVQLSRSLQLASLGMQALHRAPIQTVSPWTGLPDGAQRLRDQTFDNLFLKDSKVVKFLDKSCVPFVLDKMKAAMEMVPDRLKLTGVSWVEEVAGRLWRFECDFVPHTAQIVAGHFQDVYESLHALHEGGYVHRDVRLANMLFGTSLDGGPLGQLCDFDLANDIGTEYPFNYNELPSERHPDAAGNRPAAAVHDMHALALAMGQFTAGAQQDAWAQCMEAVRKGSAVVWPDRSTVLTQKEK